MHRVAAERRARNPQVRSPSLRMSPSVHARTHPSCEEGRELVNRGPVYSSHANRHCQWRKTHRQPLRKERWRQDRLHRGQDTRQMRRTHLRRPRLRLWRAYVRHGCLRARLMTHPSTAIDLVMSRAKEIEKTVLSDNGGTTAAYKAKIRSLFVNLKDKNNPSLRASVVSGELLVSKFCRMSSQVSCVVRLARISMRLIGIAGHGLRRAQAGGCEDCRR